MSTVLTIIYLLFVFIITIMVVWNMFESKKLAEKITGAIILILLTLRLLLIR